MFADRIRLAVGLRAAAARRLDVEAMLTYSTRTHGTAQRKVRG
jgi:hypothetical protein